MRAWQLTRTATLLVLAAALVIGFAATAGAHAELRAERPAAGSNVGGSVTTVDASFVFMKDGAEQVLTLRDPSGEIVPTTGPLAQLSEAHLQLSFAPLIAPGRYEVNYLIEGADGDFTPGTWFFTWDPGFPVAPEFVDFNPLGTIDSSPGGLSGLSQVIIVISAVVLTLALLAVVRRSIRTTS